MIILNKKRITLILSGIFLSVFVFTLTTGNAEEQNKYISTVSLPASGKTIIPSRYSVLRISHIALPWAWWLHRQRRSTR